MIVVPEVLAQFNLTFALVLLVLSLIIIVKPLQRTVTRLTGISLFCISVVLTAGGLYQNHLVDLTTWEVVGSIGRVAAAIFAVMSLYKVGKET